VGPVRIVNCEEHPSIATRGTARRIFTVPVNWTYLYAPCLLYSVPNKTIPVDCTPNTCSIQSKHRPYRLPAGPTPALFSSKHKPVPVKCRSHTCTIQSKHRPYRLPAASTPALFSSKHKPYRLTAGPTPALVSSKHKPYRLTAGPTPALVSSKHKPVPVNCTPHACCTQFQTQTGPFRLHDTFLHYSVPNTNRTCYFHVPRLLYSFPNTNRYRLTARPTPVLFSSKHKPVPAKYQSVCTLQTVLTFGEEM